MHCIAYNKEENVRWFRRPEQYVNIGHSACAACDNYITYRKPVNGGFIQVEGEIGNYCLVNRVDGIPGVCGDSCCAWIPWEPVKGLVIKK